MGKKFLIKTYSEVVRLLVIARISLLISQVTARISLTLSQFIARISLTISQVIAKISLTISQVAAGIFLLKSYVIARSVSYRKNFSIPITKTLSQPVLEDMTVITLA